jgi:hypothetical protein
LSWLLALMRMVNPSSRYPGTKARKNNATISTCRD